MRKIYRQLLTEQKKRSVIFSSCLSTQFFETQESNIHEVLKTDEDGEQKIKRLKDDKFFNNSHFKFNIIRT